MGTDSTKALSENIPGNIFKGINNIYLKEKEPVQINNIFLKISIWKFLKNFDKHYNPV